MLVGLNKCKFSILCAIILFATIVLFVPACSFGLINCDDFDYILKYNVITDGLSFKDVLEAFSHDFALKHGIWMPLTWMSYMFDFSCGSGNYGLMHLHSIFWHALNAGGIFVFYSLIVKRMNFRSITLPLFCALFWAWHPLRCESVVWLASRKDVMAGFCEIVAIISWMKSGLAYEDSSRGSMCKIAMIWYLVSMTSFMIGIMCKPSIMTFPVLMIILDVFIIRKIDPMKYILPIVLAIITGGEAAYFQEMSGAMQPLEGVPLWARLLNAAAAYGMYFKNTVWPIDLAMQCTQKWPNLPRFVWPGLMISLAVALYITRRLLGLWDDRKRLIQKDEKAMLPSFRYAGKSDFLLAGALWFSVAIVPMLGIANFGYHSFADRFTYIPSIGLGLLIMGVVDKFPIRRRMLHVLYCVILIPIMVLLLRQETFWRDDQTIWEHTIAIDGEDSAVAHGALGMYYFEFSHDIEKSLHHFRRAFELDSRFLEGNCHVYMLALCEKGLEAEGKKLLDWASRVSQKRNDRLRKMFGEFAFQRMSGPYSFSRLAYFIMEPKLWPVLDEELTMAIEKNPSSPTLMYIQALYAKARGKSNEEQAFYRKLVDIRKEKDYIHFRFVGRSNGI